MRTPLTTTEPVKPTKRGGVNHRTYDGSGIQGKPAQYKYELNLPKLYKAVDSKRRSDKLSWGRLAARYNMSPSGLINIRVEGKKNISANMLICVLKYLKRP